MTEQHPGVDFGPDWWEPKAWPLFWRRVFFVTLPISGPIWLALVIAGHIVGMAVVLCIGFPIMGLSYLKEALWDNPTPGGPR